MQQQPDRLRELVERIVRLVAKTRGRDRICRLLQYGSLLMAQHPSIDQLIGKKLRHVSSEMRTVRKVLKVVLTVELLKKLVNTIRKLEIMRWGCLKRVGSYCQLLEEVFGVLFHLLDHRVLLGELGVIDPKNQPVHLRRSLTMWLLKNVFELLKELFEWTYLHRHPEKLPADLQKQQLRKRRSLVCSVRALLDCLLAGCKLSSQSDIAVGTLGVLSTAIGLYELWSM